VILLRVYNGLHVKYPSFLSHFNETRIPQQIFEKYFNIKFHENPSNGNAFFQADRQTDRHDEANSRFVQFYERT